MRTITRRLILETTADQWSDADVNDMLNISAQNVQTRVMEVDPEAFNTWARINITKDERFYPMPTDALYETELAYTEDAANNEYQAMKLVDFFVLRDSAKANARLDSRRNESVNYEYARTGRFYYLGWKPSAAITDGLENIYVRALSMANDTDVLALVLPLHYAVCLDAALNLGIEGTELALPIQKKLDFYWGNIPKWYRKSAAGTQQISMNLGKAGW